uniref:TNase-like domain-containing protein n=1 Tax=viral metagenome TaxID=1070528 RepID=A0A6C0CQH1_9ZZZZ
MEIERFMNHNAHTTQPFSLDGTHCWARVIDAHDGDTIKVIMSVFGDNYFKFSVRLAGIDTCELRSKNTVVRALANEAKTRLLELVTGNRSECDMNTETFLVYLHCHQFDKYGRLLADVFLDDACETSVSDILLGERLAYPYTGKTKKSETEQLSLLNP